MADETKPTVSVVDRRNLPAGFPTHKRSPEFLEALGRAVAAFGFLEEILGKAIFAFTATKSISEHEVEAELEKWGLTLAHALRKAVRHHGGATITNLDDLLGDLRKASTIRNALYHGSWRAPDDHGRSVQTLLVMAV
jgi:hypothetical protein